MPVPKPPPASRAEPRPSPAEEAGSWTEPDRILGRLVTAQRMEALVRLVPGLGHELNNPLQAIIGFSKLLGNDPAMPEELRSDASLLVTEATRTWQIVENLIQFLRQRPPERHPTRLGVLVESVLALQSYEFGGGIDVAVDIPADLPRVPLDRALMQQVILNLTQNAIQALRVGSGRGTVRIAGRLAESAAGAPVAQLTFADDGPGVGAEDRDHLFQAFHTTMDPVEHSGLGLYVSHGIVAGHGGSLRFEPGSDGGSVFTLELPLAPASADASAVADGSVGAGTDRLVVEAPASQPGESAQADRRMRILVLDDDESIRGFLARALRAFVDVVATGTGPDALALIETDAFDGILCDHRMPGMTGIEVYERIATSRPELARHFILMSGDVLDPELVAFAEETGARMLAKPFETETLHAILREMSADIGPSTG